MVLINKKSGGNARPPSSDSLDHWFHEMLLVSSLQKHWGKITITAHLLAEIFFIRFCLKYFLGTKSGVPWSWFLKKGQLFVLQQVFLSVAALLHDFRPFVQWCLLVGEHDGCLLFQTEITSTWFFAVDGGLFDDPPLQIVLDPPSFEFPDMCWQRSVLELAVPLGWRVERVVPLVISTVFFIV